MKVDRLYNNSLFKNHPLNQELITQIIFGAICGSHNILSDVGILPTKLTLTPSINQIQIPIKRFTLPCTCFFDVWHQYANVSEASWVRITIVVARIVALSTPVAENPYKVNN